MEGIRTARAVVSQPAFDGAIQSAPCKGSHAAHVDLRVSGIRGVELLPGAHVVSDQDLEAWVIQNVDTGYHPVGTCRMSADSADGVVDGVCSILTL